MALTQISTGGVKNDAVTAGKIPANAIGSSEIADDAVDQGAIADEAVDEARLQISNAGTNGQFLSKQSGNTGGLTWADANSYTHPNHSGEVTSTADGAQVIASDVVDEDNLKISNSGSNGQFLQKQSGNTGGLTWATPPDTNTQVGGSTGVDFIDNTKARFGTGNDLEVYHDGSHSWIKNTTGNTTVHTGTGRFKVWSGSGSNEEMIDAIPNGAVKLMYDDSLKFETTSGGVNVTGALTVNGAALASGAYTQVGSVTVGNGTSFSLNFPSSWWNTYKHLKIIYKGHYQSGGGGCGIYFRQGGISSSNSYEGSYWYGSQHNSWSTNMGHFVSNWSGNGNKFTVDCDIFSDGSQTHYFSRCFGQSYSNSGVQTTWVNSNSTGFIIYQPYNSSGYRFPGTATLYGVK